MPRFGVVALAIFRWQYRHPEAAHTLRRALAVVLLVLGLSSIGCAVVFMLRSVH